VPFDLTAAFTRDVVFNPGDAEDDEFDPGSGDRPLLTVDGHDGTSADNPAVRCLPRDGRLGPHRLGDYSRPNSIQLGMGGPPVRVEVPRRRYLALRFLLAAGWGDSRLAVSLESAGGVVKEATVTCNNWRNDIPPGGAADVMEGAWPVRRQLDHIRAGNLVNDSNGVLFEAWLAVDPRQELATIVFLPKRSWFAHDRARANVLAITGVAVP
jgi:hypothetical protein